MHQLGRRAGLRAAAAASGLFRAQPLATWLCTSLWDDGWTEDRCARALQMALTVLTPVLAACSASAVRSRVLCAALHLSMAAQAAQSAEGRGAVRCRRACGAFRHFPPPERPSRARRLDWFNILVFHDFFLCYCFRFLFNYAIPQIF